MKNFFSANSLNNSEIIRKVYNAKPAATNKEIKNVIRNQYGIEVGSNLIAQAVGSENGRKQLVNRTQFIVQKMKEIIGDCGNDVEYASRRLRMAI